MIIYLAWLLLWPALSDDLPSNARILLALLCLYIALDHDRQKPDRETDKK